MTHWEDRFIFGSRGYWYVIIGEQQGGYFSTLASARRYVRRIT